VQVSRNLNGSTTLKELNEYAPNGYSQQEMYDAAERTRSDGHEKRQGQQDRKDNPKHV
jgi:hypothetical protein